MREKSIWISVMGLVIGSFLSCCCFAMASNQSDSGLEQEGGSMKVLMIIAPNNFRDEELFQPKQILEEAGVEVIVASRTLSVAKGMLGGTITPDAKIDEVDVAEYDGVIFVGGMGASTYWDDPLAHKIAQEAVSNNKVVGAICIAPVTLANAGILEGKKATVWSSEIEKIKLKGGIYTGSPVERDGNIITGSGPTAAREFGQEILKALSKSK
jgi:protease I